MRFIAHHTIRGMERNDANNLIKHVIGFNIKRLRRRGGQSQQKFADMVGMNRTYLSLLENGKMNASVEMLVKIADGLDVPLTDLFRGLESHAPHRLPPDTAIALVRIPD